MIKIHITDQLYLKQIELSDAVDIFNTIDQQRSYLNKWLPFVGSTYTLQDSQQFINAIYTANEGRHELVFVIYFENHFVGLIGFKDTDYQNKKTEIGYWLSQQYQKKGIMTQCVNKLINFAFCQLELNRIQIKCAVGNIPSNKIPKRLGFKFEGAERDGEVLSDGNYVNLEIYSLIKKDLISSH